MNGVDKINNTSPLVPLHLNSGAAFTSVSRLGSRTKKKQEKQLRKQYRLNNSLPFFSSLTVDCDKFGDRYHYSHHCLGLGQELGREFPRFAQKFNRLKRECLIFDLE